MSAVAWLSREEMVALGWTLLHFCWQGTAVALGYALVDRMTSRSTSKVRYAAALGAFMLMPLVVLGTFALEMRVATPAQATEHAAPLRSAFHLTEKATPIVHELPLASDLEERGEWLATRAERLLPWVDGVWLAGVLLLGLRSLGGWWQLEMIRRNALRMVPQPVERAFQRISEQVHAGRKVALRISDYVISPLAMGVWRATVILPMSAVMGMPREELEAVMAHELGHIRRWDYVWNLMQTAVESVLFFHPAVWWLSSTVRERREVCCDEIAVECCAGAAVYARALLRLEEQRTVKLRMAMALGGCGGSLLGRIRKVLGEDMAMESRMTSGVSVATAGAVIMALLLGPKASTAVAAPVLSAVQPVVAQVIAAMPATMSQMPGVNPRVAVPAPAPAPPIQHSEIAPAETPTPEPMASPALMGSPSTPMAAPSPAPRGYRIAPIPPLAPMAFVNNRIELRDANGTPSTTVSSYIELQEANGTSSMKTSTYLDEMRAAGYPLDLNDDLHSLVALKAMEVTPEYAKSMGTTGLGKPTVHDLIMLKSMGVTPEYVASLNKSGIAPKDFHEVVTEKSMGITPEYAAEMKQKGFGDLSVHELVAMKSMGITPEYAAEMKEKGFGNLSVHDLIAVKAQGMTPEQAGWLKRQFPQATTEELRRAAVFHLDEKFVADAKSHGFDDKNLDKLLKLKMSGLLDQ